VNTSPQFLKIYTGYVLGGLEVCSQCRSSLSQRPPLPRYCHLRSTASAICSDWHSTGSTRPDCNWTTKFRSQLTRHMEPSATSTTVTGPVGERLQARTEDTSVLGRPAPLRHLCATYKYPIQTYLVTYLSINNYVTCICVCNALVLAYPPSPMGTNVHITAYIMRI